MAKTKKGLEAPRVDEADPRDLTDAPAEELRSRESHDAERYDGGDLTEYDLEGSTFSECVFEGITFGATRLRGSRFVESVFVDPFAPEFSAARTTWRTVRVDRPRWGSAELFDAELESVRLSGGKIDFLNLRGSTLRDVVIENCAIGELDLGGVRATRVALVDCRVGTLDVTSAELSSVDLRTTTFDRIDGIPGLRGAIIDDQQLTLLAPLFAAQHGVIVE
ncbi:pentapeptide repeat-containing protein [Frondihabitans sucicola]|nr:pentapeptide repeat-containing protein [Frondihabitans sucicola]